MVDACAASRAAVLWTGLLKVGPTCREARVTPRTRLLKRDRAESDCICQHACVAPARVWLFQLVLLRLMHASKMSSTHA